MAVGSDAEEQHVERRHRPVVLRPRRLGELVCVALGRAVEVLAAAPVAGGHRVHTHRVDGDVVEQRVACLGCVAFRMSLGQEALVAPPHVEGVPVDRVACGGVGQLTQRGDADAAAGQHD